VVSIGGLRLEPGETKTTLEFIPGSLPSGVTEVTSAPTIRPIILSSKLSGSGTVTVPETYIDSMTGLAKDLTGNYIITIYATGECTIQLNGVGVARYLGQEQYYEIRCMNRTVDTVVVALASGLVYVSIEGI
jgi:hypothetical protein